MKEAKANSPLTEREPLISSRITPRNNIEPHKSPRHYKSPSSVKKDGVQNSHETKKEPSSLLHSLIESLSDINDAFLLMGFNPSTFNTDDKNAILFKKKMQFEQKNYNQLSSLSNSLKLQFRKIRASLKPVGTYKSEELIRKLLDDGGVIISEVDNEYRQPEVNEKSMQTDFGHLDESTQINALSNQIESEDEDEDSSDGIPIKKDPNTEIDNKDSEPVKSSIVINPSDSPQITISTDPPTDINK